MKKQRIDQILFERKIAESVAAARALVMSGTVLVDEKRVEKSSEFFSETANIRLKNQTAASKYVGRGGLKMEKALREFHICPNEYVCLDVGASTGGFTDCLLQNGAKKVFTIDVGTNQLVWKLRRDSRVEARENVNARRLKSEDFPQKFNLIVMDVSFISAAAILPALPALLLEKGKIIVLIKPQFEVNREDVGKGGIITDPEKHLEAVEKINKCAVSIGLKPAALTESPITGADGNKEFLALYERENF